MLVDSGGVACERTSQEIPMTTIDLGSKPCMLIRHILISLQPFFLQSTFLFRKYLAAHCLNCGLHTIEERFDTFF